MQERKGPLPPPSPCRKPHCSQNCSFKKHRMPNPSQTIAATASYGPVQCAASAYGTERHPGSLWPGWGQPPPTACKEPGSRLQPPMSSSPLGRAHFFFFFLAFPFVPPFAVTHFPLHQPSSWVSGCCSRRPTSRRTTPGVILPPSALPGPAVRSAFWGDTRSADPHAHRRLHLPQQHTSRKGELASP